MGERDFDTLIIGQGLAGSALAWHLIQAGQRVAVIDDGHRTSSSRVAAGLINPLAGMRFNRRPELDDWLRSAMAWYEAITPVCGRAVFHPLPMLRLFRSVEQQRFHKRRREDPTTRDLLDRALSPSEMPHGIHAPHGGFVQHRTGYVDLPLLLGRVRDWLRSRSALLETAFTYARLQPSPQHVAWDGLHAGRAVFCEGARLADNPWFNDLPLAPDKGEILDLRCTGQPPGQIVNGAHWLIPMGDKRLRFGATHEHRQLALETSAAARGELLEGLQGMIPGIDVEVTAQQVGIRPGTRDRYPFLGHHPDHPRLWVCNGFGARGALSIPWYTRCLADTLLHGAPLPAEGDIRRLG